MPAWQDRDGATMRVPDRNEYHRIPVGLFIGNAGDIIA
jgi:hypothetical protein